MLTADGFKRLMLDEGTGPMIGEALMPYYDGNAAIIGRSSSGWPTIGFGHNLVAGITMKQAMVMLTDDLAKVYATVDKIFTHSAIPAVWADVAYMIQFNTGNLVAWPSFIAAVKANNNARAQSELMDSDVYRNEGHVRYERFVQAIRDNHWTFTASENALYVKWLAMATPIA